MREKEILAKERDEKGLRSLFGDGAVVLPADKHIEGYELFAILAHVGVKIFDRVFAETKEVFGKNFEAFRGTKISFIVGFGSWGWDGNQDGEFKIDVEIENLFYGGRYKQFLIFRFYRQELGDFSNGEWIEVERLESSNYGSFWGKFLRLKKDMLDEFSK